MATVTFEIDTPSSNNVTSYPSGSFNLVVGDLMVVFVFATATVQSPGTCTDSLGEVTFTLVTTFTKNASLDTLYCYIANGFATSTSARTVTFDCTGDAATGADIQVYAVAGMSKAGLVSIRQSAGQSNQGSGATPTATFGVAVLTGNPTLGMVANATNPATVTNPTNWTEGADSGYATPTSGMESVFRNSGSTSTTITWGSTYGSAGGCLAIELDASSLADGEDDTPPRLQQTPFDPRISVWQ